MKRGQGRVRIIKAAIAALLKHGRSGVRVDEVAAAAEINKRMIYHYFDDREGLIEAALSVALGRVTRGEVSVELQTFIRSRFPNLAITDERIEVCELADALRVLVADALLIGRHNVSEHSLTTLEKINQKRLAVELMSNLFPSDFPPGQTPKPVYRLQSESRRS